MATTDATAERDALVVKPTSPEQRIWLISAVLTVVAGAVLLIVDLPDPSGVLEVNPFVLVGAFFFAEVLVIHLPTRRGAHTVSLSEIVLVIGLAFTDPAVFIIARLLGAMTAYAVWRRQSLMRLAFNGSMLVFETVVGVIAYHAILRGADPSDPIGWLAALVGVVVTTSISALLVSLAIIQYEPQTRIRDRSQAMMAGIGFSVGAGIYGVLAVVVLSNDTRAGMLLAIAVVPLVAALRLYERLARRHDELGIAYALTKDLESYHSATEVASASMTRIVEVLKPEAVMVLSAGNEPVSWFDSEDESIPKGWQEPWEETLRYHRDVCQDGDVCACARRVLGTQWSAGRSYRLVVGDDVAGMMIVRPRSGAGGQISETDHRMLEAIGAQLSSALTRIAAVTALQREIEENQALVRSKDQLIASVSHELRTPLTGIIGFAELLADSDSTLGEGDLDNARYIATEAQDLGNIVEDLLTAARADLGALEVQAKPVSSRKVIERAMQNLRTDTAIEIVGPECWISADAPRVRQILRNLLTNALKYGGPSVEVSSEPLNGDVLIRVTDDGNGVPTDRVESIFEPYESAHNEPSQPGSLGLGLSISRTLARLMGGDLTYHRIAGHTEFRLRLPAVMAPSDPTVVTEAPESVSAADEASADDTVVAD